MDEPKYDRRFSGPDARYGCVVAKIAEFRATLKGSSESVMDQSAAKNAGISAA